MLNSWLEFRQIDADIGSILCNVNWTKGLGKGLAAISSHGTKIWGCFSYLFLRDMIPGWLEEQIQFPRNLWGVWSSQANKNETPSWVGCLLYTIFHAVYNIFCLRSWNDRANFALRKGHLIFLRFIGWIYLEALADKS